ncbi:hypothetical protein niasHT_010823 [Heterodera trifolii]|uniref:Uncharacterized protein n=1 Tax=Heterodera trifolii TaxID=157864 RepID=A0ABD2KVG7_9BILA
MGKHQQSSESSTKANRKQKCRFPKEKPSGPSAGSGGAHAWPRRARRAFWPKHIAVSSSIISSHIQCNICTPIGWTMGEKDGGEREREEEGEEERRRKREEEEKWGGRGKGGRIGGGNE